MRIILWSHEMTQRGMITFRSTCRSTFWPRIFGSLNCFLSIEVARSKKGILLSQRKYVLDFLSEAGMLACMSIGSPMDMNTKLLPDQGEFLENDRRYKRLVKKLSYLTVTRPNITFAVSTVSQFLSAPRTTHLEVVMRILRYLRKSLRRWLLYSDQGTSE